MKFWIDTAIIKEIEWAMDLGLIEGVTTNPTLLAKSDRKLMDVVGDILELTKGMPVSIEAVSQKAEEMIEEAKEIAKLGKAVVVKIPMTEEGMKAVAHLEQKGIHCNVTLAFTPAQAIIAAKMGASYISPFVGRLDDAKEDGIQVVREMVQIYKTYNYQTQIVVASVRNVRHVIEAALAGPETGADICTVPFKVLQELFKHPLTDKGIAKFLEDWEKIPK